MYTNGLTIRRFPSAAHASRALARDIAQCVSDHPRLVFGLPTGRTPIPLYRELVALFEQGRIDFSDATTFNLDEFLGLPASDRRSYRAFMQRHLFDHVNLPARQIHFLNGQAPDVRRECQRYERQIAKAGGLDLLLLGLGANGHIGFNEPGTSLRAGTHRTRLTTPTRRANAELFDGRVGDVPREALSMGMATILHSRRIVLLATGSSKAAAVKRLICGPITPRVPASFLQLHRCAEIWVDAAAAAKLTAGAE